MEPCEMRIQFLSKQLSKSEPAPTLLKGRQICFLVKNDLMMDNIDNTIKKSMNLMKLKIVGQDLARYDHEFKNTVAAMPPSG